MNTTDSYTQSEIDSAWTLWEALQEHMTTLWARYEKPFSQRMIRELHEEQDLPWDDDNDFSDQDIPF